MASTYTSNSGIEKPGIGDQSGEWGTTINTNMDILDRATNGVGAITLSGTTHTLTTTDGALSDGQYKVLVLGGSPSGTNTITIAPNDQDKLYFVVNSSGQTATFTQGDGANVSVVNGDTKIIYADGAGSGAVVTEFASEVDALEGITAGTVAASKAVIVDANKDIASFRHITLTGELDAGSLDVSGDADIDGTLEADAMTLNGTAITATATLSTGISNTNVPVFTSGVADDDFLRVAGTSIEGRSASEVLSDIGGQASLTFGIANTNAVKVDSGSVADDEYARFTANGLESRSTSEVLSDIGASAVAGSSSIVTTGALNSGSITSGFGAIDNGASAITTTGAVSGGTITGSTSVKTPLIEYTDGDDAITIANGGGTTFAQTAAIPAITGLASINSGQIGGSRNKIINGAMEINQRGTAAVAADGAMISDRWKEIEAGGGNMTCQVVADAPASFRNSIKAIASTADDCSQAADEYRILHRIEGNNVVDLYYGNSGAKTTTLSFWVKSSLTGNFPVGLENSASNRTHVKQYTINSADTWEKKSVTFVGDETGTWLITNGVGLMVNFVLGAGSNYTGTIDSWQGSRLYRGSSSVQFMATVNATYFVTGVQLEVGSTATDFEYRSFGEELALCQRYLYKSQGTHAFTAHGLGSVFAANQVDFITRYPVTMRAIPTISKSGTIYGATGDRGEAISSMADAGGSTTTSFVRITLAASDFTIGECLVINNVNDAAAFIQFEAEL